MRFRLHSPDINVPEDDPFQNDMLERKRPIEILTSLLVNLEGSCTLAIDAAWGHGKTTFLNMWAAYLRGDGFSVVGFNAWETDYCGNPFLVLSTELTNGLQRSVDHSLSMKILHLKEQAAKLVRRAAPIVFQELMTAAIPIVGASLGQSRLFACWG